MFRIAEKFHIDPTGDFDTRWDKALIELESFPEGSIVFVNSMSDTYYEEAPLDDVQYVHQIVKGNPGKTFLILTKRPERLREIANELVFPPNLWIGVSIENNKYFSRWGVIASMPTRPPHFFISFEPLLEDVSIKFWEMLEETDIAPEWVIVGGESGPNRRPFNKAWVLSLLAVANEYDIPLFFKQGSAYLPEQDDEINGRVFKATPPEIKLKELKK